MSRSRHLVFSERFVPTRVVPTARFADAKNPLPHSFNDTQSRFHPVRPLQARADELAARAEAATQGQVRPHAVRAFATN